jgi:hypothetical protein
MNTNRYIGNLMFHPDLLSRKNSFPSTLGVSPGDRAHLDSELEERPFTIFNLFAELANGKPEMHRNIDNKTV